MKSFGAAAVVLVTTLSLAWSHVALLDPPARNVLWRSGYPEVPEHKDDDYLPCIQQQDKLCPPCGDSHDSPKPHAHEAGGEWALGIIARNYTKGETVPMAVSVTNSHGGYIRFKLCPNNDVTKPVTQKCLDGYPLEVSGYPDGKVQVTAPYQATQDFDLRVRLPADVVCSQCVVQMTLYTDQFKPADVLFRNCADIGISDQGATSSTSQRNRAKNSSKSLKKSPRPQGFFDQTAVLRTNAQPQIQIGNQASSDLTIADQLSQFGNIPQNAQFSSGKRSPSIEQVQILDRTPIFAYGPDFMNGAYDFKAALEFNNQQSLQRVENNRVGNQNFQQQSQPDFHLLNPFAQQVLTANPQNQKPQAPNFLLASSISQVPSLSQSFSHSPVGDSSLTKLHSKPQKLKQRAQHPKVPFQNPETVAVQTGSLEKERLMSQTRSLFQKSKQIASQTGSPFQNSKQIGSQAEVTVNSEKSRLHELLRSGNVSRKQKSSSKRESDPDVGPAFPESQVQVRSKAMFPEPSLRDEPGFILAHIY